jgi:hypothetical protein
VSKQICVTNVDSGYEITLPHHAFSGRFFPSHSGIWSAALRSKRNRVGAFFLALIEMEGSAPFECAGGQKWIASSVGG